MNKGERTYAAIARLTEQTCQGKLQWHRYYPRKNTWWQSPFMELFRATWGGSAGSGKKWALYVGPTRYAGMVPHEEFWIALLTETGEVEARIACGGAELVALTAEARKSADEYLSSFLKEFLKETDADVRNME